MTQEFSDRSQGGALFEQPVGTGVAEVIKAQPINAHGSECSEESLGQIAGRHLGLTEKQLRGFANRTLQ